MFYIPLFHRRYSMCLLSWLHRLRPSCCAYCFKKQEECRCPLQPHLIKWRYYLPLSVLVLQLRTMKVAAHLPSRCFFDHSYDLTIRQHTKIHHILLAGSAIPSLIHGCHGIPVLAAGCWYSNKKACFFHTLRKWIRYYYRRIIGTLSWVCGKNSFFQFKIWLDICCSLPLTHNTTLTHTPPL